MSNPLEDPHFKSAYKKFSSDNEGEFDLQYLPLQGNEVGWDKFSLEFSLSYIERLACQTWVRDHRDKVITNPATIIAESLMIMSSISDKV
jgi:hypothetical protein